MTTMMFFGIIAQRTLGIAIQIVGYERLVAQIFVACKKGGQKRKGTV